MFGAFGTDNVWESRSESYTAGFYGNYSPVTNSVSDFQTLTLCRQYAILIFVKIKFRSWTCFSNCVKWMHHNSCTSVHVLSSFYICRELVTMPQSRWLSERRHLKQSSVVLRDMVLSRLILQSLKWRCRYLFRGHQ